MYNTRESNFNEYIGNINVFILKITNEMLMCVCVCVCVCESQIQNENGNYQCELDDFFSLKYEFYLCCIFFSLTLFFLILNTYPSII
jgi:hypothetical protein